MISIRAIASALSRSCELREARRAAEAAFVEAKRASQDAAAAEWEREQTRRHEALREQEEQRQAKERAAVDREAWLRAALLAAKAKNRKRK
jgi:hypothetical protein